jgi:hypothetical protein
MYRRIAVGVSALLLSGQSDADQPTIKGYMFGDYYYIASGADKEQNGFQIRRIYLTLDKTWNTRFSGRFRLESSDAGFGVGDKMRPAVKDAYLKYKRNSWSLIMGLSPTPATSRTDGIWGYRSVAKSIQDLNKLGSTRDTGLLFETPLDARGKVVMQAMFGNGSGNQSETNNGKKGHLRLELSPGESLGILLNGDYESRPDQNLTTLSALVHSSGNDRAFAIEGVWQNRGNSGAGSDVAVKGISVFGRSRIQANFGYFARVDYFDPSDQMSDDIETRVIVGVDLMPEPNIHIMPNVIVEAFQDSAVETVVTPRITLYYKF